jgi:hypothetical protein
MPADEVQLAVDEEGRVDCGSPPQQRASEARRTAMAGIYGWASLILREVVRYRPLTAVELLQADPATKHYVALALRGWEVHQHRSRPALRRLSVDLFERPRRDVLSASWGLPFGRLSVLKRLPGRVLTRAQYDHLVRILRDPQLRGLLNACPKIRSRDLAVLNAFNAPLIASASLRAVADIGGSTLSYVLAAIRRHRPDVNDAGLIALCKGLRNGKRLAPWLHSILQHSPLPQPPWDGRGAIAPLRTVSEIQKAGKELHNCLVEPERWLPALLGQCCYYRVGEPLGPAVVAVVGDGLIGAWRIDSCAGEHNRPLRAPTKRQIFDAFATAGIHFYGDDPRHRTLRWYGLVDGFPLIPRW